ncbi:spermidine synthase [Legionella brunensis]|uniref:Spermidine synthase n=1 Tax=Legionella brunensis TaxID=29422 RepID=A0A0W0ST67_9GAMM|nr:fused MFS/spermidine synthase [Legionella brunensis]KTC86587.1 spermidine synthase [Legionella brunensis]
MWKTFYGRCIYKSSKGVQVFQNFLFRWLKFNSHALQTLLNRYYPYRPGLYYISLLTLFVRMNPTSCCMFGLGGAGAAHALYPYRKNLKLTVVEYDSDIIDIAQRFFMTNRLTNMEIIHQDAQIFAKQTDRCFQHLLVDLFTDEIFPAHCNTEEFFNHCKRILLPEGILAVNLANRNEQWPIFQLIKKSFANATIAVPVKKSANIIIFATKNESVNTLIDLLKQHKSLKRLFWDTEWGCIAEIKD